MHIPNNAGYTPDEKLKAVQEILSAQLAGYTPQRDALIHWDKFIPYLMPAPSDHENDVYQIAADRFETLHKAALEWFTNHRFTDVYARLEALESFVGLTDRS